MSDTPHFTEEEAAESAMEAAEVRIHDNIERLSGDLKELEKRIQRTRRKLAWPKTKARQIRQWTNEAFPPETRATLLPLGALASAVLFISIWQTRLEPARRKSGFSPSNEDEKAGAN